VSAATRVLLLFSSIHNVLAAESELNAAEVPMDMIPVPKEISPECGMAITVAAADRARALEALADARPVRVLDDWRA
jgi:hypothetical protein